MLLKTKFPLILPLLFSFITSSYVAKAQVIQQSNLKFYSKALKREVTFDVILPQNYEQNSDNYKVLYMNDGQDLAALNMINVLNNLYAKKQIEPFILVAIYANENRLLEYGTAGIPDYQKRGAKASQYTNFVIKELMPDFNKNYRVKTGAENTFFCGYSLGGLSAMDIVWAHPEIFSKVGVFSGSFWWRSKDAAKDYDDDKDRIMHSLVRNGTYHEGQKFWFECGTADETDDRNKNGIIDSIDDTQGLIKELLNKGYKNETDIQYYEVQGGQHNQDTWAKCLPVFLKWLLPSY